MSNVVHNSSTITEVKFASGSLRSFAGMPNTMINLLYNTLTTVFAIWSCDDRQGIMREVVHNMTSMFLMLGGSLSSIVDSMLVKSTWTSSFWGLGYHSLKYTTPKATPH